MGEKERFSILEKEKINNKVRNYLKELLQKLTIEGWNRTEFKGNVFDLMEDNALEGWCWQTTESMALFMPDDTIVYRGDLSFDPITDYYHSFVQFEFEGKKYVFDPCLCLINTSDLYFSTFEVKVKGKATSKQIRKKFFERLEKAKAEDKKDVMIYGGDNPSEPMFRNSSEYRNMSIKNNKIIKLTAHYYCNG